MKFSPYLRIIPLLFMLNGCFDGNKNTEKLCEDNPELRCEEMNMDDGQCRVPRTKLIWHRRDVLNNPTNENKIQEYRLLHVYQECMELASQIQVVNQMPLQQKRYTALVNTYKDQKNIIADLEKNASPEVYYFLWHETGAEEAKRKFLALEGTDALETTELQYALASYYTIRDKAKALLLLEHSLELSTSKNYNPEIFTSLASMNQKMGNREHAYIWAMVSKNFGTTLISDVEMQRMYPFSDEKIKYLKGIVDEITDAVKKGRYNTALLPRLKDLQ